MKDNVQIIFDVAPDFIRPFFPEKLEETEISVLVKGDVDRLLLQGMFQGTVKNVEFTLQTEKASENPDGISGGHDSWRRWTCRLSYPEEQFYFHLVFQTNGHFMYFSRRGAHPHPPAERDGWMLVFGYQAPEWVAETVFYQIFPDRFRNADSSVGVRNGEYRFDGGISREVVWNSEPLEWNEGRCLDFYNGDLEGIRQSIPHFQELGINALYLNPIFHSRTHHRYDSIDFFNVDPHLGGNEALARLSEDLHKAGIRLILDISINHSGSDHPWFTDGRAGGPTREYYYFNEDDTYLAWYGVPTLPQLNYGSAELRRKIWQDSDSVLRKFLKAPYNIDGWRFDVANQTGKNDRDNFTDEIWMETRKAIKEENPDAYIVAEHWDDASDMLRGDHWDAVMNYFGSARPIRSWFGEQDRYLTQPHEYPLYKTRELSNADFADYLLQCQDGIPSQLKFFQFNVVDTHDIARFHNNPDIYSPENLRAALTVQFMLPGSPVVYYGDEIRLDGHVRSHEGVRFPMEWDREKWDAEIYDFYRNLINFRKTSEALQWGIFKILHIDIHILVLARYTLSNCVLGVINRSSESRSVSIPIDSLPPGARDSDTLSFEMQGLESRLIPQVSGA